MLAPFRHHFHPLEWAITLSADRSARALHVLSATVYVLLSLLVCMQILSRGAVQRIAAQSAGAVLLVALAGLLLLLAVMALGNIALREPGLAPSPGASDALLHFALAVVGLDLGFGHRLLSNAAVSRLVGGPGLLLLASGVVLLLTALLPGSNDDDTLHARRLRSLRRRDHLARGLVLAVLGAFLFEASVDGTPGRALELARSPWELLLLATASVALLTYGLHALWLLHEESRIWQM